MRFLENISRKKIFFGTIIGLTSIGILTGGIGAAVAGITLGGSLTVGLATGAAVAVSSVVSGAAGFVAGGVTGAIAWAVTRQKKIISDVAIGGAIIGSALGAYSGGSQIHKIAVDAQKVKGNFNEVATPPPAPHVRGYASEKDYVISIDSLIKQKQAEKAKQAQTNKPAR